ncbi:hypothetical protein RNJ44_04069 [Nakaseomyces bracarensis]|uniref:Uncharacterized protein n=1 Tax=Nakaseomyces bracarensis TaxID=273131 RepID=A0ABR4NTV6_9SACH
MLVGGFPRGDARCLVCNACNRLALLDVAGIDFLARYVLEYKPGVIDCGEGKGVLEVAKKKNQLYLFLLGYLSPDNNKIYELKALIRAIDAVLNKFELPPMRDLAKLVRSYSPKYDPYGYWDTVGEFDPVDSVTKMLEEEMRINDDPLPGQKHVRSPFYDVISVVPDTTRRLPAIEVKNVALSKFKFDKNVWERLNSHNFPVRLYLLSRKDPRDPNSDIQNDTKIDYNDGTPIAFPTPIEVWFNNIQIKARFKGLKDKEGTVNPVDLTDHIKSWRSLNTLKIIHVFNKEAYLSYCALVRPYAPEEVLNNILVKPAIPHLMTFEYIKKMFRENDDTELVTTSTIVSLKCPISYSRIKYPIKSKRCDHLQCYDALWFLHSQVQVPNWVCPVCQIPITLDDLYICEFSMRVLNSCANNVEQIELLPDCTWNPIYEMEDLSESDDEKTEIKSDAEQLLQHTNKQQTIDSIQLGHKIKETPIVSLLSDEEDFVDIDNVEQQPKRSSLYIPNSEDNRSEKSITLDPLQHNDPANVKTPTVKHDIGNITGSLNNDEEEDDLPLTQVARKRGLPIDHLLNSTESSFKQATKINKPMIKSRLSEKRKLSPALAPNILGKKPLQNSSSDTHLLNNNKHINFSERFYSDSRSLDPKLSNNMGNNNIRRPLMHDDSNELVLIHRESGPGNNDSIKLKEIGLLDNNPFVSQTQDKGLESFNLPSKAQHSKTSINNAQLQGKVGETISTNNKYPPLPPMPTNIMNRATSANFPIKNLDSANNGPLNHSAFVARPQYSGFLNNPLGSRPVVNPFLPRKPTHRGNGDINTTDNSKHKDSPWFP